MRQQQSYSVSELMWNTLGSLVADFHGSVGAHLCSTLKHCVLTRDTECLRLLEFDCSMDSCADKFKKTYQLLSFCKRAILDEDRLSSSDLELRARQAFDLNQNRLSEFELAVPKHFSTAFMYARGLCHQILGDFDLDEHLSLCRHGRHAAVGVPLRQAKLDTKWSVLSGSQEHIQWFRRIYLKYDDNMREFLKKEEPTYSECTSLRMSFVPKSYKSMRSITPNTVLGALHSDGLGRMIVRRLKYAGLDVAKLQHQHRQLAQSASQDGLLTTCDQSSASDNLTVSLVESLLPRRWFDELSLGRITDYHYTDTGERFQLSSFCTMGIGFTFALQTLIFYCIARGIEHQFSLDAGLISCFGDDLIFPTKLWPFFEPLFRKIGLQINSEKTFYAGYFRESCGGDYYRGVDVRPFQPKWVGASHVNRKIYESVLYRLINGFRRRWDDEELSSTLLLLMSELQETVSRPCVVPYDFPDTAGIRVASLQDLLVESFDLTFRKNRNGSCIFSYLRSSTKEEKVISEYPFLHFCLRYPRVFLKDSFSLKRLVDGTVAPVPGSTGIQRVRGVTVLL